MLHIIKDINDQFWSHLTEDPVRPHIAVEQRIGSNRDIFASVDQDQVTAITCVSYQHTVPMDESELFDQLDNATVVIFYTIWSYAAGAGRQLIFDAVQHIQQHHPEIKRFVTLSPKTEMARKFHLKNGAVVHRENVSSVNYEYLNV